MAHYPHRRSTPKQDSSTTLRDETARPTTVQSDRQLLFSEMLTDERARIQEAAMEEPERWDGMS